jgi:hypothetical protein
MKAVFSDDRYTLHAELCLSNVPNDASNDTIHVLRTIEPLPPLDRKTLHPNKNTSAIIALICDDSLCFPFKRGPSEARLSVEFVSSSSDNEIGFVTDLRPTPPSQTNIRPPRFHF